MFHHLALATILICGLASECAAQNVARLYPRKLLEADAVRYGGMVNAEYRGTILPRLTADEKKALAPIKIEFPIAGPRGDPFEFYTDGSTIYLPALSLRFYADLCFAHAWLNAHGFDGTTVRDYVGLLFREASLSPTAPLPPVFKTLGVPENVREETAVAERGNRSFGNTVVFILAHELGHALQKHRGDVTDSAMSRTQEIAADAFAIEIMRRLPQIPLGLEHWFDFERIRHAAPREIPRDAEWQKYLSTLRHPVTTERLNSLAIEIEKTPEAFASAQNDRALWTMRTKMFAQYFRMAAPFAGNATIRVAEYSRVRDLRLSSLKPRKAGFQLPTLAGGGHEEDFQGFFQIEKKSADGGTALQCDMLMLRTGDEVGGSYSSGAIDGFVEGMVEKGALHFTWKEGAASGRGRLESSDGGVSLRGVWGKGQSAEGGGTWTGARRSADKK